MEMLDGQKWEHVNYQPDQIKGVKAMIKGVKETTKFNRDEIAILLLALGTYQGHGMKGEIPGYNSTLLVTIILKVLEMLVNDASATDNAYHQTIDILQGGQP